MRYKLIILYYYYGQEGWKTMTTNPITTAAFTKITCTATVVVLLAVTQYICIVPLLASINMIQQQYSSA